MYCIGLRWYNEHEKNLTNLIDMLLFVWFFFHFKVSKYNNNNFNDAIHKMT